MLVPVLFAFSCKEKEDPQKTEKSSLSIVISGADQMVTVPMYQSKSLDIKVTAEPGPATALNVTIGADPALVATYNSENGTSFTMLPSDAYEIPSAPFVLPRYNKASPVAALKLKGTGCELDKEYILPIVVKSADGADWEFKSENADFVLFKMTPAEQQGSGTKEDPYLIHDVKEFMKVGNLLKDNETVCFRMESDVDFSATEFNEENPWKPINYAAPDDEDAKPAARKRMIEFDGNGHKIVNFKAGGSLFGTFCGSIQNLVIEKAEIDNDGDDASILIGVAGASDSQESFTMKNVKVTGSKLISDYKRSGALIAHLRNGIVSNCESDTPVSGQQQVGGLIGRVDNGMITDCSASGDVSALAYYSGGLIGFVGGETVIKRCHATGNVRGNLSEANYARAGGLIGQIEGNATVEQCYATGNVIGGLEKGHMAGGLIAVIGADDITVNILQCYATGNVSLPHGESGNWAHAGGLLGTVAGSGKGAAPVVTIENCYSTGSVEVRRYSGGFVGSIFSKPGVLKIKNCYTTSDISGIVLADRCGLVLGLMDAAAEGSSATCTGFVAWNACDRPFSYNDCVPLGGNYYGTEGTVSQQASALGWDTAVWDLSKDLPTLK